MRCGRESGKLSLPVYGKAAAYTAFGLQKKTAMLCL